MSRALLIVLGLYFIDRVMSLTGIPFLQLSIWGSTQPASFDAFVYLKFWIRIIVVLYVIRTSLGYLRQSREEIFLVRPKSFDIVLGALFSIAMIFVTGSIEDLWMSYGLTITVSGAGILLASAVGDLKALLAVYLPSAFYEEILYSFILVNLKDSFGQSKIGIFSAILATSTLFGLSHFAQGEIAFVMSFTRRLFYCMLLLWRKNLAAPVTAHAIYNINAVIPLR